jgi:hypothetical protein
MSWSLVAVSVPWLLVLFTELRSDTYTRYLSSGNIGRFDKYIDVYMYP